MEKLFQTTLKECSSMNGLFSPFPKAEDRISYEKLDPRLRELILQNGRKYGGYRYPYISAEDYMEFTRTGNRVHFEDLYFSKRRALNACVLAECISYEGNFISDIINGIYAICDEPGWQLPAHNTYVRDSSTLPLPDTSRPVLDLFACETGAMLACVYYLLKEELDQVSPLICKRMEWELDKRIKKPYLKEHFWWMGKGNEPMCNWTIWCTQNILLTTFFMNWERSVREKILIKSARSCDYFLKDYAEDGCCEEGAQYYRHAGLCLFNALEVFMAVTKGGFSGVYQQKKIQNIASYIEWVHVHDRFYFNFADCSPVAGRAGVREFLFGKRTAQEDLISFAADDFRAAGCPISTEEINLFYRMQEVFTYQEIVNYSVKKEEGQHIGQQQKYYAGNGLFISKGKKYAIAVKAGNNNDSHNHNDTGSFILYKDHRPMFVDIGVESYTAKTFSKDRYDIWTMQSAYHNLPTIEGLNEQNGEEYGAKKVKCEDSSFVMNIESAYPLKDNKVFYRRKVALENEGTQVRIEDTTNAANVVLNFIVCEKVKIEDGVIEFEQSGRVCYSGAELLCVDVLPITDERLRTAWKHDLYRMQFKMTQEKFIMTI